MRITKPDTTNESQDYWEEVLVSHGLGERQLGLHEEPEDETDEEESEESETEPLEELDE